MTISTVVAVVQIENEIFVIEKRIRIEAFD